MTIREKLEIIQKTLGLTQTKLAERFGVSFVAFNNWWTGKSEPRANAQTALNYLFDRILRNKKIDENLILKLHGILMNGIRPDAGSYRNHGVRITGVDLPTANHMSVRKLTGEVLMRVEEKTKDIVALSAQVHAKFEQIHPFSDGNGRIGRLLMNAMLLKENIAPAIIRQEKKRLYYAFLYKAQTKEDYSQLEDFLCEAIMEGFTILERTD